MERKPNAPAVRVLVILAVAVMSSGCAMKGDIRLLQAELRAVSARQDSLMAQIRAETLQTQDTLRTQGDAMFDLRGDFNRQLQQITESLMRIEAITGDSQRGLVAVRDQLANIRRLPAGGTTTTTATPSSTTGDTSGESLISGGGGNPDDLWAEARGMAERGSLRSAQSAFEAFIADHPNDERVPDAHFYLADILTQQDRPEDALEGFQEVQRLFPASPRVPDALYRIAELHLDLGDTDAAKATLERIMNTYPGTMSAMLARELLEEIG